MTNKPTIGIIGNGRFGKLWSKIMAPLANVKVFDRSNGASKNTLGDTINCDLLFLLVPISEMESVCKKIAPHLHPKTIIIDACSVKTYPMKIMKKWLPSRQPIIATHPLFGPDSIGNNHVMGQKIVVSSTRASAKQTDQLENILKKLKLIILKTNPRIHDKQMARSQALVHLLGRALKKLNLKPQEISTPDYHALLQIDKMVNNDTWQLFFDMQKRNPYAKNIRKSLITALQKLENKIEIYPKKSGKTIIDLRKKIDMIDREIITTISKRLSIVKEIGTLKKQQRIKVKDAKREQKLHAVHERLAKKKHINPTTIHGIFTLLMKESRAAQSIT